MSDNSSFARFDVTKKSAQKRSFHVPLEVKLKAVFDRYCDIKKKKQNYSPKFDEFGGEISASKLNSSSMPLISKNLYLDCVQKSNISREECNFWKELAREQKVDIFKMMFLLRNETEKNDKSLREEKTLAGMETVEISKQRLNENIAKKNDLLDSQMTYPMDTDRQSKYVSQRRTEPDSATLLPQQQQQPTSSTLNKTLINFTNTTLASPIPRSSLPKAIERKQKWPGMEFLGIKSVFELFTDDENESESPAIEPSIQYAKHFSDNTIGESQYTVSRILKICEEDEKNEQKRKNSLHISSSKKRRLDIGSVRDLFTDDEDDNCVKESQLLALSDVKNVGNRSSSLSSNDKSNVGDEKDKSRNITVHSGQKSDDLFSTYNESTCNLSTNEHDHSTSTPKKNQDSNLFVYQGSPSLLNRSLSALNCYISQTRKEFRTTEPVPLFSSKILKTTDHIVDKSSMDLNEKLEFVNTQLTICENLDDFNEIKENFSSPYATCRSTSANNNLETGTFPMNGNNPNCDTEFTDDDLFATCTVKSVNNFTVRNSNFQI